jgi:hypothetical protein
MPNPQESPPQTPSLAPAQPPQAPPTALEPVRPGPQFDLPPPGSGPSGLSKLRLALAFGIAAVADTLFALFNWAPPVALPVDFATAFALFVVLGWRWLLLPGLVMEAIPGLAVFPFWTLVVAAIAVWGTVRPKPDRTARTGS